MDKAQSFAMQYGYYDKEKKRACCVGYNAGYKQAEKDLALTLEDVKKMLKFARASIADALPHSLSDEELAKEALRRFNEQRKK